MGVNCTCGQAKKTHKADLLRTWITISLLLAALCALPTVVQGADAAAPTKPPGGLSPSETPQFILWSFDDEVNEETTSLALGLANSRKNPNGCRLPLTWFACTSPACAFDCAHVRSLHSAGHEVAAHTRIHAGLRFYYDKKMIEDEILGSRDDIVACGIPKAAVEGFRSPYLADSPAVRQVLEEGGFRYDSSIGVEGGAGKPWPASMAQGMPFDCSFSSNDCSPSERYPGMWEVPLYSTLKPDPNLMDYCTVEGDGSVQEGCDPYEKLKQAFDEAYQSNRAPVTIGVHKAYMQHSQFRAALGRFLDDALAQPDVWAVTHSQLLDWMEAPVPASQMRSFMAQYDCTLT